MNELEIIVLANHKFVSSHVVSDREITIGSGEGCSVQLPNTGVAAEHAIVHFTGRSCIIEDLESGSGITVKGQKVPSHMVKSEDEVGIAGFVLRFVIHREVEHTPTPGPAPSPLAQTPATAKPAQVVSMVGRGKAAPAVQVDEDIQTEVVKTEVPRAEAKEQLKVEAPKPVPKYEQPVSVPAKKPAEAPAVKAQKAAPEVQAPPLEAKKSAPAPKTAAQPKPAPPKPSAPAPKGVPVLSGPTAAGAEEEATAKFIADNPNYGADATREIATSILLAPTDPHPDDDDDEDEENFVAPFSLVSKLTENARVDAHADLIAEAIFYADEAISYVRYLAGGRRLKIDGEQRMVVAYNKGGGLQIASKQPIRAQLFKDGRAQKAAEDKSGKLHVVAVPRDAAVSVELSKTERLHLQFREKLPAPPPQKAQQRLTKPQMMIISGSILFHIVAFIFISLTSSDRNEAVDVNAGRFAQIDTKDLELEKPPPPPPPPKEAVKLPEEKPQPMPKPTPMKMAKQAPAPTKHQATPQAAPQAQHASTPKPSAAASNLLSALGGQLSGGTPTSAAAAATTNLDAVQAPRGGGFKVAGVIGKMPGDGLRLASAGGAVGRIDTKSASEIAGGLGGVRGSGPSGKVRGVVTEPPARSVEVQGSLDRSEIQKVVNAHLYEVQACYEHQLVRDPNLSGKVVAEWVITLNGSVGTTRIKNSTVRSGEVASCIQASIKHWTFPHPRGGSVTVTYPFVFSTVGM